MFKAINLFIVFLMFFVGNTSFAQDDLYREAKSAYLNRNCSKAILLLEKFMDHQTDLPEVKKNSIEKAIDWCKQMEAGGVEYRIKASGYKGPPQYEIIVTEKGESLLKIEPELP